ncbi:MAG TPA: protein kinase, partial [Vicinamibacterales bacterium]|nr:protein kinase [Vicinamibacterales bacterium]
MRLGVYEIRSALGAGGMGEVYRARDTRLGRDVAIKVVSPRFTRDAERLSRFEREARTLASLNHPGIGAIYGLEYASAEPGEPEVPALVLELVEGETLADRIQRGPLPVGVALSMARQIADALDVAHERGIVHRDLKPANVKITPEGVVKILDFGLAKALLGDRDAAGSDSADVPTVTFDGTRDGLVVGTPSYMSPEQARGRSVDRRTDVWAFGCVLYEMLTGRPAFRGATSTDTIVAVLEREPELSVLPGSVPESIRRLVRRCLQKDARRRLRDIADASIEIEDVIANPAIPVASPAAGGSRARSGPRPVVAVLGLAVAAALGWWAGPRQAPGETPAFGRIVRFVSTAAHEFAPVISPDGKWVAYLSNARGQTDVWVKFIAGGDAINLTAAAGLVVQSVDAIGGLAVSPDGAQVAFQAQSGPQLGGTWVVPAPTGGQPRRLLEAGSSGMQWSPDGRRIAFVRTGGPLGDALMVADADGQNATEVVARRSALHVHWVRWDPDGRYIYFNHGIQNMNAEPTEVFRVPSSGGPVERVVGTTRRALAAFPSPDGSGLFYAANPDSVDLGLWWKDLRSGRERRITTGVGEYNAPSVSIDGTRLVGTVQDVRQSLERVALRFDGRATMEALTDGFSGDIDPAVSPDGGRIVFSSSRSGSRLLWTAPTSGTQPAPLTSGDALDDRPAYSPDGQQIAFVSDRGGTRGIWLLSVDSGTPRLVSSVDVVDTLSWSPDGRRIVFSAPVGDAPGLMTVDVENGRTDRIATAGAATRPVWSPRDDLIAYIEPRGGNVGAYLRFVRPDGRPAHDQTEVWDRVNLSNGQMSWSPDGRRLAAVSLPGAFVGSLWIIEPEASDPFR